MMLPEGVRRQFRLPRGLRRVRSEVDDEIRFHVDAKTEALIATGMSPAGARAEALRQLGDPRALRAELEAIDRRDVVRRARRDWWSDWWLDIRHAARSLARTPGISAAVILMLALGIGANAAMFDVLDRIVLRAPPHLADPSTLVRVAITTQRTGFPEQTRTLGPFAEVTDYERGVSAFSGVAGYSLPRPVSLGDSGGGEIRRSSVTARLFEVLGTRPMAGRAIDTSDVMGPPVVVISYNLWRRHFHATPTAIGQGLVLDGTRYTVVGVMPRGFSGAEANAADAWTLVDHDAPRAGWRTTRNTYWLEIVARLRSREAGPRASWQIAAVRREAGIRRRGVRESATLGSIVPGRLSTFDGPAVRLSIAVSVVCALLLVIAVANTANLLLVRAMARLRELAVRVALGAGRGRLIRYLMIESGVLALVSGVAAAIVTLLAGRGLRALLFPGYAWTGSSLGGASGAFAAMAALLAALAAGLVPALLAGRSEVLGSLRGGIRQGRGARGRVRSSLVAAQLAVTTVLLAGSGLFARSLARATAEDHGVALRELVYAGVPLRGDDASRWNLLAQVRAAVRRVPSVRGVTVISDAPMRSLRFASVRVPGADTTFMAMRHDIAPDFLRVTGLRLLAGRGAGEDDRAGSERVVMVDSMLARQAWPGRSPIGQCLAIENAS
ncbi:MAG: hypothetical protein A2085_01875, partial [Gemmatimonadetes bacterium GWC2_71_10]